MTRSIATLPGPSGLPLVGDLPALAADPLAFLTRVAREHGSFARFRIGGKTTVLLTEPALVEEVLVRHRAATKKDPITASLAEVLGSGLLTNEGEPWRERRRLVAPSFQPQHLAALAGEMVASTDAFLATVPDGPRDVHPDTMRLTLDIAVRTLFGTALDDAARVGPLVEELMVGFDQRMHTWRRLLPAWVPTEGRRAAARTRSELRALLLGIVARRRGTGGDDLLARLLEARDEHGAGLDDDALLDELVTLFLAGHETTALAVGFSLWLLGSHPDIQARAAAEVDTVLGGRVPTAADARRLVFLDAVAQEAMRLYPPAWTIGREVVEPFALDDVLLPAGTAVLMPQWVVHRDPRWFEAPEDFRPDRWLTPHERPKFSYFPFGGGPRVCVGNHFARMETVLVLARYLERFSLTTSGPAPALMPSVTLRPKGGLPVTFAARRAGRVAA